MNSWSRETAYAIGLITTDGNLSKDKRHISLTSTEPQLLITFKKCLHLKNRICANPAGSYSKNKCYKVTFGDVDFYKNLLKIGLMPNKTFRLSSLKIPNKFFADFLIDHIDGDGSIIRYKDNHNSYKGKVYSYDRLYVVFRSSSPPHIRWIRRKIKRALDIKGSMSGWRDKRRKAQKEMWSLRFCKNESLVLIKYLYYKNDLPCLERKRDIALSFLNK